MSNLRNGSRGPEVKLLQEKLNQNLYRNPNLVPDGIFGSLTKKAVRAFQMQVSILVDGIAGSQTKSALGMPVVGSQFTHRVRLHFRSLALTDVPFDRIFASTQEVYANYGIRVDLGTGESLNLSAGDAAKFEQVDGSCTWKITSGEYSDLQHLGTPAPANDIIVYFVDRFSASINGCGGHLANRPACIVAKAGTNWCAAHEVCHVLLTSAFSPVHMGPPGNLMHPVDIERSLPTLTPKQVAKIKSSPLCRRI